MFKKVYLMTPNSLPTLMKAAMALSRCSRLWAAESCTRQLGLWLRDGVTGVGTLTYYDPATGRYGALGHGISDETSGVLMPLRDGSVLSAVIADARHGGHGTAGELVGSFDPGNRIGAIERNCIFGIFGA